jgi:hypothetical protein
VFLRREFWADADASRAEAARFTTAGDTAFLARLFSGALFFALAADTRSGWR